MRRIHIRMGPDGNESAKMREWIGTRKWKCCCQPIHDPDPSRRRGNEPVMWSTIERP
jgi:hypothetical protein